MPATIPLTTTMEVTRTVNFRVRAHQSDGSQSPWSATNQVILLSPPAPEAAQLLHPDAYRRWA